MKGFDLKCISLCFVLVVMFTKAIEINLSAEIFDENSQGLINDLSINTTTDDVPKLDHSKANELSLLFEKTGSKLEELLNTINRRHQHSTITRFVRSPQLGLNFRPAAQCTVSKDKLVSIRKTINSQLLESEDSSNKNSECDESGESDNCNIIIKLIQCGVHKLKIKFDYENVEKISYHKLIELRNVFETLEAEREKLVADSVQSATQEVKTQLDEVNSNFQILLRKFDEIEKDLKLKTKIACIAGINSGSIDKAVKLFEEREDSSLLASIIQESYNTLSDADVGENDKKINNFDNIVHFIRKLTYIYDHAKAYPILYETMKSNDHLSSPKMLILAYNIKEMKNLKHYPEVSQEDKDKINALGNLEENVVKAWSDKIRNGDYEQIKTFASTTGRSSQSFYTFLPEIIKTSYAGNLENVENILKFIRILPFFQQVSLGYSTLYDDMNANDHLDTYQLIMLAYRVKTFMSSPLYQQIPQRGKDEFDNLKLKFTKGVQALVFSNLVFIESRQHSGYTLYGNSDGSLKTFPSCNFQNCNSQKWFAKPLYNGRYFYFKNKANNLAICVDNEGVFLKEAENVDEFYWEVVPVQKGTYFYFKNKSNGKTMDASYLQSCGASRLCSYVRDFIYSSLAQQQWIIKNVTN